MVMKNAIAGGVKTDLLKLYNKLVGKLGSLENLVCTQNKCGDFRILLLESILPEVLMKIKEREKKLWKN